MSYFLNLAFEKNIISLSRARNARSRAILQILVAHVELGMSPGRVVE